MQLSRRSVILSLALVAVLSCLPLFLFDLGGDVLLHYVLIECFAGEFWQGNLYPRWCFGADAGMGSPAFLFYFPLAYWPAAFLYPLKWLGLTTPQIHVGACLLASFVTAFTSYRWLRGIAAPWPALVGAMVYLLIPYRMEVMLYRAAYAELWGLAVLPLVFIGWRTVAHSKSGGVWQLAIAQALLALAHTPLMLIAAIAGVLFMLLSAVRKFNALVCYAISGLLAMMMSAFYLVPAKLYQPDTNVIQTIDEWGDWPNRFLTIANVTEHHQERLVVIIVAAIVAALFMAIRCWLMRDRIVHGVVKRELAAWVFLLGFSIYLFSPVSTSFWNILEPVKSVAFPWRVQSLIAASLVFFFTLHVGHPKSERKQRTARGDAVALVGLMSLVSFFLLSVRAPEAEPMVQRLLDLQMVSAKEYRTRWVEEGYAPTVQDREALNLLSQEPRAEVISGSGMVSLLDWRAGRIVLGVRSFNDSLIRLRQRYFPIWYVAKGRGGAAIKIRPQNKTGWIVLSIPAGEYELTLKASVFHTNYLVAGTYVLSLLAWLGVGWGYRRELLQLRNDF